MGVKQCEHCTKDDAVLSKAMNQKAKEIFTRTKTGQNISKLLVFIPPVGEVLRELYNGFECVFKNS